MSSVRGDTFPQALAECRKTARLGLLLALAAALYVVEAQLPALPIPGARLGLANLVSVLVLFGWGVRETLLLGVLRQVLGGALTGTLFGLPFYFGLAGAVFSTLAMGLVHSASMRRLHPIAVSVVGALAHNVAQLGVAYFLIRQPVVLAYLPYLIYLSLPAGIVVGYVAAMLLPTLHEEISRLNTQAGASTTVVAPGFIWARVTTLAVAMVVLVAGYHVWQSQSLTAASAAATYARVTVDGREVARLPLKQDAEYEVPLDTGHLRIVVQDGEAAVVEADCPDQTCVRTGKIRKAGQGVVCVPNRVTLDIVADANVVSDQSIDAVTW